MTETATQISAKLGARLGIFRGELEAVVQEALGVLEEELGKQAGLKDHSLKDLAALGHPYRVKGGGYAKEVKKKGGGTAWRAGITKVARTLREGVLGHDIKGVHIQGGGLTGAIFARTTKTDTHILATAGVDPTEVPYVKWIVTGTRYMVPRDFIGRAGVIARSRVLRVIRKGINNAAKKAGAA